MKKRTLIQIGLMLFLYKVGFLVGARLSKTVSYMTGNAEPDTMVTCTCNPCELRHILPV